MCKARTDRGKKEKPSKGNSSPFGTGIELEQAWTEMDGKRRFLELIIYIKFGMKEII